MQESELLLIEKNQSKKTLRHPNFTLKKKNSQYTLLLPDLPILGADENLMFFIIPHCVYTYIHVYVDTYIYIYVDSMDCIVSNCILLAMIDICLYTVHTAPGS